MSKRTRRKFTDEFKYEAVKLVTEQGYTIAEAARNLGINANLLGRWKKEVEQHAGESNSSGGMTTIQAELKRLRKENKQFFILADSVLNHNRLFISSKLMHK